ncbi:MAG: hypothetical protein ACI39W_02555 [Brotaphodocola sp.]
MRGVARRVDAKGQYSLILALIRQLCLNIPILFLLNWLCGMTGIIWTQAAADILNVIASYYYILSGDADGAYEFIDNL